MSDPTHAIQAGAPIHLRVAHRQRSSPIESPTPLTCLIVDDHAGMREVIKRALRDVATRILECTDGDEVCAAYELHRPDWVLMDVRMARTDGITATRELRAKFPEARVVMLTQQLGAETRERALEAGALQFFLKEDLRRLRQFFIDISLPLQRPPPERPNP